MIELFIPLGAAAASILSALFAAGAVKKLPPWTATAVILGIYIFGAGAISYACLYYFGSGTEFLTKDQSFSDFLFKVAALYGAIFAGGLTLLRSLEVRRANNHAVELKASNDLVKALEMLGSENGVMQIAGAHSLMQLAKRDVAVREIVKSAMRARIDQTNGEEILKYLDENYSRGNATQFTSELVEFASKNFGTPNKPFVCSCYFAFAETIIDNLENFVAESTILDSVTFSDITL